MPNIRVGYGSDFVVKDQKVGIGSEDPRALLDVRGTLKGDFNITGVSTLRVYGGFAAQKQNITKDSSIRFSTTGIGTFTQPNERETGFTSLVGEYNTVSEDLIVDEGKIFEISTTNITGITTLGTQEVYAPDDSVVSVGTLESVSIQSHFSFPDGGSNDRPDQPTEGMVRFNDDLNTLEFYNGIEWRQFTVTGASGRGLFAGGRVGPTPYNTIDFINIQSLGNAQDFGDMQQTAISPTGCSSEIRGIFAGGYAPASGLLIDYVTMASAGDALDFGDLSDARRFAAGTSSSTRGVFMGGRDNPANNAMDVIDYIEIGTLGNALDFGNLATADMRGSAAGDRTRGIYIAGNQAIPAGTSQNQFITIASKGNGTNFGSLQKTRQYTASSANSTRMVIGGGSISTPAHSDSIETYIIQSLGNSVEFGNLSVDRYSFDSVSTQTRAVWAGGSDGSTDNYNIIEYITISTGGSAIDFGDLTEGRYGIAGCSDSHGGLGGF